MSSAFPEQEPDEVEQLVFQCLEADDLDQAIEALRRDRPELEARVLEALDALRGQGLLDRQTSESMPERLGPFRLIRELGAGGMGIVYLAEQEDLSRRVALKLIRPEQLYFPGARERFQREVEAVARLQHDAIVSVFTVGEENGLPFFSMEFVAGGSLAQVVRALSKQDPARLTGADLLRTLETTVDQSDSGSGTSSRRAIFEKPWTEVCVDLSAQIAEALAHAHERGVLHRDVKPSNVLITRDGQARLVDFGLARMEGCQQLTQTASQIGSLPYMPPEQLAENTAIPSVRQDVYSLGVSLYEMLALRSPFLGATAEETRRNILDGKPPALRQRNPAVSWELETVCLTAMDPDPGQRYASMADFLRDLENVRLRQPIHAKRPSIWIRMHRWQQRNPTVSVATAVAFVLIAVAGVLFGILESSARREANRLAQEARQRATEAATVTNFLVDLFRYASPDTSLGEDLPLSLLLNQGASRVEKELADQPEVRARMLSTFGKVYSWLAEREKAVAFFEGAIRARREATGVQTDFQIQHWRREIAMEQMSLGRHELAAAELDDLYTETQDPGTDEAALGIRSLVLRAKGRLASLHGQDEAAERYFREALAVQKRNPNASEKSLLQCTSELASFLSSALRYPEAQVLFDECLASGVYQAGHPYLVTLYSDAARNLAFLGRRTEAQAHATSALAEATRVFGEDHPTVAKVLQNAAVVEQESGRVKVAIRHLERAYRIAEKYRVFSKQYFARILNDLGNSYHSMGRYDKAVELLDQALVASRTALPGDHVLTAFLMLHLADSLAARSDVQRAEKLAAEGLAMIERMVPETSAHARALTTVAWIAAQLQKTKEARTANDHALQILARYPNETRNAGRAHAMQALLANLAGSGAAAEAASKEALELFNQSNAGDHPDKALCLYHRAWARLSQNDRPGAERFFKASIEMYRRMEAGSPYPDIAWPLNHLGFALLRDRPEDAIPYLVDALKIRRAILPRNAYWRAVTTVNLGMAYANAKRFEAAEPLLLEAHERALAVDGIGSPPGQASARRMTSLYEAMRKPDEAAKYRALLSQRRDR